MRLHIGALLGMYGRVCQFPVTASDDRIRPRKLVRDFINLDAHFPIREHPIDFWVEGRKTIEMVRFRDEV